VKITAEKREVNAAANPQTDEVQGALDGSAPNLVERLRAAGYKITPPRLAVLDVIRREREHLNPNEILEQAKAIYPEIGRATVYRTLELLTELGIVRPIYVGDSGPTYIRAEGGHHHLVCSTCGRIEDFDQCIADEMAESLASRFGFRIRSHLLEFYGLCAVCQESAPQEDE
jgi:Fur family ferric uptake transcriptional regulator